MPPWGRHAGCAGLCRLGAIGVRTNLGWRFLMLIDDQICVHKRIWIIATVARGVVLVAGTFQIEAAGGIPVDPVFGIIDCK